MEKKNKKLIGALFGWFSRCWRNNTIGITTTATNNAMNKMIDSNVCLSHTALERRSEFIEGPLQGG